MHSALQLESAWIWHAPTRATRRSGSARFSAPLEWTRQPNADTHRQPPYDPLADALEKIQLLGNMWVWGAPTTLG